MDALIWAGLAGFLGATLLLSAFLGAQRGREEFNVAHRAFERSVDSLSPISNLAKFMAENDKTSS